MLKLRRGVVVELLPLTVEVDGERRPAWADTSMVGEVREGDDVIVNTEALDLGLGSGGFDLVHVNLTRGLGAVGTAESHVMKLNYSSIQHPVAPVERRSEEVGERGIPIPVLVIPLHGHLAPATWAAAQAQPGKRIGYVQSTGGALPGRISRDVAQLRSLGLLCGHITAAPAYGGEQEALHVAGALDAAANRLGWGAAVVGPGPGIIGSDTHLGHGGLAALDNAHAALALGMPTLVSPRLSSGDPRSRHLGLSHHTKTVLELLLADVQVPMPETDEEFAPWLAEVPARHQKRAQPVDLDAYAASGLPTRVMGRDLEQDRLFFAAALASGSALAEVAGGGAGEA